MVLRLALCLPLALLAGAGQFVAAADEVTIYRCTDAEGRLTLRDSPCDRGERQQTIEMQRPKDPPPRPKPPRASRPAPAAEPPQVVTRVVVVDRPAPVYECTTADGETYISDNIAGNPRWVPLWTLGYPARLPYVVRRPPVDVPVRPASSSDYLDNELVFDGTGRPSPPPPGDPQRAPELPPAVGLAYSPGTWIHDACQQLPPAEICQRLRDRHWELGRRYNSALQSERERIDAEQRGINARLDLECT